MSRSTLKRTAVALVVVAVATSAFTMARESSMVGRFDFGYEIRGTGVARPLQVFDDGESRTYFQFHPDDPTPAVLENGGTKVLVPEREGPFTVVSSLSREFTLVMGESRSHVRHDMLSSYGRVPDPGPPVRLAALGPGLPAGLLVGGQPGPTPSSTAGNLRESSYATPLKGDVIEWRVAGKTIEQPVLFVEGSWALSKPVKSALTALAAKIGLDTRVIVVGREDASMKDGLAERRAAVLRDALVAAGVPPANVVMQIGTQVGQVQVRSGARLTPSTIRWTPFLADQPAMTGSPVPAVEAGAASQPPLTVAAAVPAPSAAPIAKAARDEVLESTLTDMVAKGRLSPEGADRIRADRSNRPGGASTGSPPVPTRPMLVYELRVADGTVGEAVARWGRGAGYELVWDAPRAPLVGDVKVVAPDFLSALRNVIVGLRQAGYPIKAKAYADGVVQVTTEQ